MSLRDIPLKGAVPLKRDGGLYYVYKNLFILSVAVF